jgi:hypothetical protein
VSGDPQLFKNQAQSQIELLRLAEGFVQSRIICALNELGVFGVLGNGRLAVGRLAAASGGSADRLERWRPERAYFLQVIGKRFRAPI